MPTSRLVISIAVVLALSSLSVHAEPVRVELVPVRASGSNVISGNEIVLDHGGQRVWLEVRISDWAPEEIWIYGFRVSLHSLKTLRPESPTAAIVGCDSRDDCMEPLGFRAYCVDLCVGGDHSHNECRTGQECGTTPCKRICYPAFVDTDRPDFVLQGSFEYAWAIPWTSGNVGIWGKTRIGHPGAFDPGLSQYVATFVVDVPAKWVGRTSLDLDFAEIHSRSGIIPAGNVSLVSAQIAVACRTDTECTDGNSCTWDRCDPETHDCSNGLNHDPSAYCCDPSSGTLTPIVDDPYDCDDVTCDRTTGIVSHVLRSEGEVCYKPSDDPCDFWQSDRCDAQGRCISFYVSNGGRCSDSFFCNGIEYCWEGKCIAGEDPCDGRICDEYTRSCEGGTPLARLESSDPGPLGVVIAANSNWGRLVFDRPITLPSYRELQIQSLYCDEIAPGGYRYHARVERALDGRLRILRFENLAGALTQGAWYRMVNDDHWPGVAPFDIPFLVMRGDANGDGEVNFADLVEVARHVPGVRPLDGSNQRFDINGDGVVNSADLTAVNAYVPTSPSPYPCTP